MTVDLLARSPDMVRVLAVACVKVYFVSPAVKNVVDTWRALYAGAVADNDAEMLTELRHMACLQDVTAPTLAPTHLDKLFATMRCKRTYWGGEFDLMVLQELLGVAFVVVDSTSGCVAAVPMDHVPAFQPQLAITLYRTTAGNQPHYETLELKSTPRGKSTFAKGELPPKLAAMCLRDLGPNC
ncbi:MAG: hypothetical protein VX446_08475, partial [Bacteroidota bacterium]|nr:hypothetical protein [Bacteroidota bacterium]